MLLALLSNLLSSKKKINLKLDEQILLLSRLANLLKKGYSLSKALNLISFDPKQGSIARQIEKSLVKGRKMEQIFNELGFSKLVISFLYFSRSTGDLDESLLTSLTLLKHQKDLAGKFKKVLQYPLLLLSFLFILFFCLKLYLLPSLGNLYTGFIHQQSQDTSLSLVMHGINILINSFFITVLVCFCLFVFWKLINPKVSISKKINLYGKFPILRGIKRLETSFLFSNHLSALLQSGLSLKNSLQIMMNQNHLPIIKQYSMEIIQSIYTGKQPHKMIESLTLFENELGIIFERGLKDGTLESDLNSYSELLIDTIIAKISKIVSLVQPTFYLFFGIIIIAIYFSILYPLFGLIKEI